MSDTDPILDPETTDPDPQSEPEEQEEQPQIDLEKQVEKWKHIALRFETKAKENAEAAAKLKELEDAGKTEAEKLQSALEEAQAKARASTIKALKLEVAAEKGLPKGLAKFLPDVDNEVDMMQAADDLLEAAGSTVDPPAKRPKSPLNSPLGGNTDPEDDRERMLASMLGRPTN